MRPAGNGWAPPLPAFRRAGRLGEVAMEFQDKTLNCVDCGAEFLWTAGEQLFFADKNFKNEPKRCKSCKAKRASRPAGGGGMGRERVETKTSCSACGKD